MHHPPNHIYEIHTGIQIWSGTKPIPSQHRHVGYRLYSNNDLIRISPEITLNYEGRGARINHEFEFKYRDVPTPSVQRCVESDSPTELIEIGYEDPTQFVSGFYSVKEIEDFEASTFWLIGYLSSESEKSLKISLGKFEYLDGTVEYEFPHIVPKSSIIKTTYYVPQTQHQL